MLINYALLPTLREVGSGRTFAEIAQRLRLTPSAVSHQMRALEAQVGFRLFERAGRRAKLTPEAESLVQVVGTHLPPIEDALEALLDHGKSVRGVVRIGGVLPFSRLWLRPRLMPLMKSHPQLRLEVSFGAPSLLIPKLQSGALDLAIVAERVDSPLLATQPIFREQFWAVCSKAYLAGARPPETLKEFAEHRFITYDDSRPMHDAWWRAQFGRRAPFSSPVACSVANLDEMLHLAEAGVGIAVLPNYLVTDSVGAGKLLRLRRSGPARENPIELVWRKSTVQTSRFQAVREALLDPELPTRRPR